MSKMKFKKIIDEKIEKDDKVKLKVQIDGFHSLSVRLNPNEKLSNIRQELEKYSVISMKYIYLFAAKSNIITREEEKDWKLNDIMETSGNDKILCLVKTPNVRFLIDHHKLEYGRTITPSGIEVASEKSFNIYEEGCKLKEFGAEGCGKGKYEYNSNESEMIKTFLSLSSDIDVQNFANFALSFGKTKSTSSSSTEISSMCNFIFYNKVSLKLFEDLEQINYDHYLEPTENFYYKIQKAMISANPRKELKEITKKFGRFISNEVFLGGKIYFEEESLQKTSNENNGMNLNSSSKIENALNLTGNFKRTKNELFKLIGSKQSNNFEEFDEKAWIESLNDLGNWGCTEYKKPVSIFRPLPYDLRKVIFKYIGKKILYNDPGEDYIYLPNEKKSFELKNMPPNIADIIQKKDAECNIFATVIDTEDSRNDFFNCQILWLPNEKPRLIIHCIQNSNFKKPKYNLKIGLMVVGYDINFNFINSHSNIHFKVIEKKIKATKSMYCKELFDDSFTEEHICLGIPVLRELNPSFDSLIIGHHFFNYQESNRIGAYIFSYCLKKNHYVELPEFTFHTLIISNYPACNEYKIIPFNCKSSFFDNLLPFNFKYSVLLSNDNGPQPVIPKYISLHSREDNWAPIFLKQKQNEIKIKYMKGMKGKENCKDNCICKKTLKDDDIDIKLHYLITSKALYETD
ncbi:unnamed protein product [Rhizophagus irregularis]|nr:unnamed protein product [Rhizophagus irregularis]